MTSNSYALEVENLMVNYEKNSVLFDISLQVTKGLLVAILGPNGAGKSSLIKAILGLIRPLSGQVRILGMPLKKGRQKIAYIPQAESIDWRFPITVLDFVVIGSYGRLGLFRRPSKNSYLEAEKWLHKVGMELFLHRQINELSGGQKQRLLIARALMQNGEIYFLDEPFSGIDLLSQEIIGGLLRALRDEGKTLFVVHHGLDQVQGLFDAIIFLNRSLVAYGSVETTFTPELIQRTFGRRSPLFDEMSTLFHKKSQGR